MKIKCLTYFISVIALVLSFNSCESEDVVNAKSVEGHWVYAGTEVDVRATNTTLERIIEEYIMGRNEGCKVSYEFKNDRTYYYYQDLDEPLKGIFRTIDKKYFLLDDVLGVKTMVKEDSVIYVISDLKNEIAKDLEIEESKLVKALAIDVFRRGLYVE